MPPLTVAHFQPPSLTQTAINDDFHDRSVAPRFFLTLPLTLIPQEDDLSQKLIRTKKVKLLPDEKSHGLGTQLQESGKNKWPIIQTILG